LENARVELERRSQQVKQCYGGVFRPKKESVGAANVGINQHNILRH